MAIVVLQEKESLNSLATKYGLSPTIIQQWREALEQQAGKVFETPQEDKRELKQLKAQNERLLHKVGQLTIDCDFFCTSLRGCRSQSEIANLEQHRPAGMCRHRYCHMMHLTRSNLYYKKKGESEQNLCTYMR